MNYTTFILRCGGAKEKYAKKSNVCQVASLYLLDGITRNTKTKHKTGKNQATPKSLQSETLKSKVAMIYLETA